MIEGEKTEVLVSIGKEGSKEDKDTAAMETDDAQNNGTSAACDNADVNMQDAKSAAGHATAGTPGAENGFSWGVSPEYLDGGWLNCQPQ